MSDLVVVTYPDEYRAGEVLAVLQRLQEKLLIDLEDAGYVMKDKAGNFKLHETIPMTKIGATSGLASGTMWGALIGMLFLQPALGAMAGAAAGAATGALSGKLSDFGIPNDFIKQLGENLKNGTSTLFILVRRVTPDKVLAEISSYGGTVLHSSLSTDAEARLQAALAAGQRPRQELRPTG
jgi:uncharacterized membrane protein